VKFKLETFGHPERLAETQVAGEVELEKKSPFCGQVLDELITTEGPVGWEDWVAGCDEVPPQPLRIMLRAIATRTHTLAIVVKRSIGLVGLTLILEDILSS
jgi:hypothetical protein